jgi:hypothetical protein
MRLATTAEHLMLERLVIRSIDLSDYEGYSHSETLKGKINALRDIFKAEKHDHTATVQDVCNWLQGLTSACSLPCYNSEIIALYEGTIYAVIDDDDLIQDILDNYWMNCACVLVAMWGLG